MSRQDPSRQEATGVDWRVLGDTRHMLLPLCVRECAQGFLLFIIPYRWKDRFLLTDTERHSRDLKSNLKIHIRSFFWGEARPWGWMGKMNAECLSQQDFAKGLALCLRSLVLPVPVCGSVSSSQLRGPSETLVSGTFV